MGGPVIKNRTFFFGSFESLRNRSQRVINATVPTANFRAGNFSSLSTALRDPFNNNAPFAGNIIPASRINSVSKGLTDALLPNQTRAGDNVGSPNYSLQRGVLNDNDQFDLRMDHNFSSAHRIFGRYSQKELSGTSPKTFVDTTGNNIGSSNPKNVAGAWNWIIGANLLNEVRGGYAYQNSVNTFGIDGKTFDGPGLLKRLGMQGIRDDPPQGSQIPDVSINAFTSTGEGRESIIRSRNLQFADNLTWIKGRHSFKFGTDIRRLRTTDITSFTTGDDMGSYNFNGQYTGFGVADYLLGIPNQTTLANTGKDVNGVTIHYGFYAQDEYQLAPRITVNGGLRYEPMTMPREKYERDVALINVSDTQPTMTSSTAFSQYRFGRPAGYLAQTHTGLGRSLFEQPHRIIANATYTFQSTGTDLSLVYFGESGQRDLYGSASAPFRSCREPGRISFHDRSSVALAEQASHGLRRPRW